MSRRDRQAPEPGKVPASSEAPASSIGDGELRELLARALEELDRGGETGLAAFLAAQPARAAEVRRLIGELSARGLVGDGGDRAGGEAVLRDGEDLAVPRQLGEFTLERCLGSGGMGVVWLARQEPLGRKVALKLLHPVHLFSPHARERFRREIDAVARLDHPGIVRVLTVGDTGGQPWIALERVDGCNLGDALRELAGRDPRHLSGADLHAVVARLAAPSRSGDTGAMPPRDPASERLFAGSYVDCCLRLVAQAAEALAHAHARGVLHRDVKPSNIMVTADGRVLLVDFGLASLEGEARLTRTGANPGSLPYMSPEQLVGADDVDARTDVYSLGVTLYELLTLAPAFGSDSSEVTRRNILTGAAPPPRVRHAGLARDVETICITAMQVGSSRRYASAADLARDLDAALARRPIAARRPGPAHLLVDRVRRRPAPALAAACVLLVTASVGLVFAWQQAAAREGFQRSLRAVLTATWQGEPAAPADLSRIAAFLPDPGPRRALQQLARDPLSRARWRELEELLPDQLRESGAIWPERLIAPRVAITDANPRFRFEVPAPATGARNFVVTISAADAPPRTVRVPCAAGFAGELSARLDGPPLAPGRTWTWSLHLEGRDESSVAPATATFSVVDPAGLAQELEALPTDDPSLGLLLRVALLVDRGLAGAALAELAAAPPAADPGERAAALVLAAQAHAQLGDVEGFLAARTQAENLAHGLR